MGELSVLHLEFALALMMAGTIGLAVRAYRKRKGKRVLQKEDDDNYWI